MCKNWGKRFVCASTCSLRLHSFNLISNRILACCLSCVCWMQRKTERSLTTCGWTFLMRTAVTGWCLWGLLRTTWSRTWWPISTAQRYFTRPSRTSSLNKSSRSVLSIAVYVLCCISSLIICPASYVVLCAFPLWTLPSPPFPAAGSCFQQKRCEKFLQLYDTCPAPGRQAKSATSWWGSSVTFSRKPENLEPDILLRSWCRRTRAIRRVNQSLLVEDIWICFFGLWF